MKLLSWNIQHGGGPRRSRIIEAILKHNPDVVALTEYRTKPGAAIRAALEPHGFAYIEATAPVGSDNGVCVISKTPVRRVRPCAAPSENVVRWLDVELPEYGFGLGVLHILTEVPGLKGPFPGAAKARFWDAVLAQAESRFAEPFLFVGDFNTCRPFVDEAQDTLYCSEHFARLSRLGWVDLWRTFNGTATEYTWFSHGRNGTPGNGLRVDHAFATPSLAVRAYDCRYSHVERPRLSDHSVVIVELA